MANWESDSSSSFSRAFSSSSSSFSAAGKEVEDLVNGLAPRPDLATETRSRNTTRSRRVVFSGPSTHDDEDDVVEIDDADLPDITSTAGPMLSSRESGKGVAPHSVGHSSIAVLSSSEIRPTSTPLAPPASANRPAEPGRPVGPGRNPQPTPDKAPAVPAVAPPWLNSSIAQSSAPSTAAETIMPSPIARQLPSNVGSPSPRSTGRQALRDTSGSFAERRPVNEHAASVARVHATKTSAALLTTYRAIKRNTQTRLYRRYYDKWLLFIARPPAPFTSTDMTPSREARATQTDALLNDDVEPYEGNVLLSAPRADAERGELPSTGCMDGSEHGPCGEARGRKSSSSPTVPSFPSTSRPLFQYSPAPPEKEGIAARSRPAGHLNDVKKPDLPRRKGGSPSRDGLYSVGLPAVVPDPIRVYRR